MSTLGKARICGLTAALGLLCSIVVGPVILELPSKAENGSSEVVRLMEEREAIPFSVVKRNSIDLRTGTSKTLRSGVAGEKKLTYRVHLQSGVEQSRELVSTKIVRKPIDEIVAEGVAAHPVSRERYASRGGLPHYGKTLAMIATGYDPGPASNGGNRSGRGATGLKIGHGLVAVDPRVIPLGTKLYVEGYGYAVAGDTGSAIKGNRIDLGHDTREGAERVGRRKVIVHILD